MNAVHKALLFVIIFLLGAIGGLLWCINSNLVEIDRTLNSPQQIELTITDPRSLT